MTPPQQVTIDVSKEKKGKKGKGKLRKQKKGIWKYIKVSVIKYFRMISYDEICSTLELRVDIFVTSARKKEKETERSLNYLKINSILRKWDLGKELAAYKFQKVSVIKCV